MFCQFFLAISCNSQLSSGHQHLLLVIWWKLCNSHEGAGLRPNPGLLWSLIMHWSDRLYALLIRPHICHFFSTNVLLGSIFLHMNARKLWQNLPKFPKISQNFPKFPKIFPHDNFFSTNIICDICDKYELCSHVWHF